ncbi:hypothetical protein ABZ741_04590 [Streptomyces globisporus]|uniref:hypothetical protein n=1 Tax=Streptomyces globisporus TaxID=1908 RepID=UPI00345F7AF3
MSAPMTPDREQEIRNRDLDEVTAGPWLVADGSDGRPVVYVETLRDGRAGARVLLSADGATEADVQFVASARRSVPELLAEVDRLRARVAELEALKPARFQDCRVCGAGYEYGQPCSGCEFKKQMAAAQAGARDALPRDLSPEQALRIEHQRPETNTAHDCNLPLVRRLDCGHCPHEVCQDCGRCPHTCRCAEDPHDSPLHHSYALGRDLPEVDPGRCLDTHPFSPRDGWRLTCGSCDHAEGAPCHRNGGAL